MGKTSKRLWQSLRGGATDARTLPPPGWNRPAPRAGGKAVDLVFVIDTTGSMSDKIQGLLHTCTRFVDKFASLGLDGRIAIIAFGDLTIAGDKIVATGFSDKVEVTKQSLLKIPRYSGGGNKGESSLEALQKAMALPFCSNAVKALVLITDEPALESQNLKARDVTQQLHANEFLTFVIAPPIGYFKEMAAKNGGKWYKVSAKTDFTDLLKMFEQVAERVSQVVDDVYQLGDGRVSKYLQMKAL
jgi:von Willebrand factor type A domain